MSIRKTLMLHYQAAQSFRPLYMKILKQPTESMSPGSALRRPDAGALFAQGPFPSPVVHLDAHYSIQTGQIDRRLRIYRRLRESTQGIDWMSWMGEPIFPRTADVKDTGRLKWSIFHQPRSHPMELRVGQSGDFFLNLSGIILFFNFRHHIAIQLLFKQFLLFGRKQLR